MISDYEKHNILKFSLLFLITKLIQKQRSKLDWTLDDNGIERLLAFLNSMDLIMNSRSFNYFVAKEGSSGV